jgi:hypothetical protein
LLSIFCIVLSSRSTSLTSIGFLVPICSTR